MTPGPLAPEGVGYLAEGSLILAHHPIVLALPFLLPVLLVVGMVAVVAWRDRHRPPYVDEQSPEEQLTDGQSSGEQSTDDRPTDNARTLQKDSA